MDYGLQGGLDLAEVFKRALKYLIEGLGVAVAASIIPGKKLTGQEILMLAVTASAIFATLDTLSPAISSSARLGSGFGLGSGLVGFGA